MEYSSPEVSINGHDILKEGGVEIQPMCSIGAAVLFGIAFVIWSAAVVWNWAAAAVGVAAAAAAVYGVGVDC